MPELGPCSLDDCVAPATKIVHVPVAPASAAPDVVAHAERLSRLGVAVCDACAQALDGAESTGGGSPATARRVS